MRITAVAILLLTAIPAFSEVPSIPVDAQQQFVSSSDQPTSLQPLQLDSSTATSSPARYPAYGRVTLNSCYTMHTIRVQQKNKNSDQVQRQSHQTCTSASVFKVKPAVPESR